ncbi:MAG: hypothetical protein K5851_06890 [Lachnospiraceae bacterium]|nr:hypothetical protein [Lachnospiraceae bacterium]
MIDFEKELKLYKEKPLMSDAEEKIKKKELTDMVDILKAVDSNSANTGKGNFNFPGEL